MRPNDLYGWYCVVRSVTDILGHAADIRINEAAAYSQVVISRKRRRVDDHGVAFQSQAHPESGPIKNWPRAEIKETSINRSLRFADSKPMQQPPGLAQSIFAAPRTVTEDPQVSHASLDNQPDIERLDSQPLASQKCHEPPEAPSTDGDSSATPSIEDPVLPSENHIPATTPSRVTQEPNRENITMALNPSVERVAHQSDTSIELPESLGSDSIEISSPSGPALRASKVPSSRLGRLFHYGGLTASLGYGAASEILRRSSSQSDPVRSESSSLLMTEANLNRLVSKLSQMRGAALKLGQFMSIQDSHILPEELERVFRRVQDGAHYMPNWQMENVMSTSLGSSWRSHFSSFTAIPAQSASIGQVHLGILAPSSSPTGTEEEVAIKIQFPDIARSISSDLGYLKILLGASALLPKGLHLDSTIKVFKQELADECDYFREAGYIRKYGDLGAIRLDPRYRVPWVWEGSTEKVLVMERMKGVSVGGEIVKTLTQSDRDEIAARVIELCLRELFEFRMMQTDPNWSNFLWNKNTRQIELIDFGATREYSQEFINNWLKLLTAAILIDREACIEWSHRLGYFIGGENEAMINAHLTSMQLLGTPFRNSTNQPFSFARGSEWTTITKEIRAQIPVMLNNRLTPPPRETYSLNRKLSGAFLLAGRLGASVDCRLLWEKVVGQNSK